MRLENKIAFTMGLKVTYDPHIRNSPNPKKIGERPSEGYDGGWCWPTYEAAMRYKRSHDFVDLGEPGSPELYPMSDFEIYKITLPNGWDIDTKPGDPGDEFWTLRNDALLGFVD